MFITLLPAWAEDPSLCRQTENTLFSCSLPNKKLVAVCAPDDAVKNDYAAVIYRYGTLNHIELTLPEDPSQFRKVAHVDETVNKKAMDDGQYLRFTNHQFSYITYDMSGKGFEFSGLAVFDKQRLLTNMHCASENTGIGMGLNSLLHIGVPEEETSTSWPLWLQLLPSNSVSHSRKP